ncbi:MAG: hypothetical protein H7317_05210 [Pseudorhodobacter sp.]|nr:hypothetical protein [Pseudorhodobacter sp.]
MTVTFLHPKHMTVKCGVFLAAWQAWFDRYAPSKCAATDGMPVSARHTSLAKQISGGRIFSLDVLCRMLVPYRNTKQASSPFLAANTHLLEVIRVRSPVTGRTVKGVRLTCAAPVLLGGVTVNDRNTVDALLDSDIEDANKKELLDVSFEPCEPLERSVSTAEAVVTGALFSNSTLVKALVDWMAIDTFQPHYRRRPIGTSVTGWAARLATYFWPNPGVKAAATSARLLPITLRGPWSPKEEADAVKWATDIFTWGGVPQAVVTPAMVRDVFESVAAGKRIRSAPMNSGWTKVAAFASHGTGAKNEQVIWDSRVAHSLIRRLDALLRAAGHNTVPALTILKDIGRVPGRGGSRTAISYGLNWPVGYRTWTAHFAGSALVREIRDELNKRRTPAEHGKSDGPWTVRDVEMVLFMDGY